MGAQKKVEREKEKINKKIVSNSIRGPMESLLEIGIQMRGPGKVKLRPSGS